MTANSLPIILIESSRRLVNSHGMSIPLFWVATPEKCLLTTVWFDVMLAETPCGKI